mgnify:CR=1 FL=1
MDIKSFLEMMDRGEKVTAGTEAMGVCDQMMQRALKITSQINGSYHTLEELEQEGFLTRFHGGAQINRPEVEPPGRDQSLLHIRQPGWIRLRGDSLVAVSGGAGFVGIDSGNEDQLVLYLIVDFGQTIYIVTDRVLVIGRTGADDH